MDKNCTIRRLAVIVIIVFTSVSLGFSQINVSGRVTDEVDGSGIPGVNILVKGTSSGTVTDFDGNYSISVPDQNSVLVFSFVGYVTQEITVGSQTTINVQLAPDVTALEEVVVVGYGTQEKKEITSAVSSVKAEEFNAGNVNNPAQLIQGKVSGLTIARTGNNPNEDFKVRLRGLSTLGANSEPLVVVDGVIGGSLQNLDPNDIASIDILKDGSAAAIYGTRGSSGVILVTTKTGEAGQNRLTYNGYVSLETIDNQLENLEAGEYAQLHAQVTGNTDGNLGASTDWFDEITQTGVSQVHNLSLSGGTDQTTYRVSFNVRDVEGIARKTGFTQYNARVNITQRLIDDRLTFTGQMATTTRNSDISFEEAFRYALTFNPTAPVQVLDNSNPNLDPANFTQWGGYYETGLFEIFNPVALIEQNESSAKLKRLNANVRGEYDFKDIIPGLRLAGFYSQQRENDFTGEFYSKESQFRGIGRNGLARRESIDRFNQLVETTLSYDGTFSNTDITALAGYSYQEFIDEGLFAEGGNFLTNEFGFNNLGASLEFDQGLGTVSSFKTKSKLIGFFGRVNATYDGTYFFSASYRREGSTLFGVNEKWGNFWAVSGGAELTQLFALPNVTSLKLRASFGVTGNVPSETGLSKLRFGPTGNFPVNGQFGPSFGPVSNSNPNLKWERKEEFDVGLDFGLMDNRITGSLDYYSRSTEDLLFFAGVPVPPNLFPFTWLNLGELDNTGFEFSINAEAVRTANFTWETGVNFATFSTELVSLSSDEFNFGDQRLISNLGAPGLNDIRLIRIKEGEEIGQIWGPQFQQINSDGTWGLVDQNGDGTVDDADNVVLGNGLPDFTISWNNTVTYGNFDLNLFFRGAFGHDLANLWRVFYQPPQNIQQFNILTSYTELTGLTETQKWSGLFVEDASFFRLDNMTLGYNIPTPNLNSISNFRFYFTVQNVFTITGYDGLDPEVRFADPGSADNGGRESIFEDPLAPGIDRRNSYFTSRTFTLGVNIGL